MEETRMMKIAAMRRLRTESSVAVVRSHTPVVADDDDGLPFTARTEGVQQHSRSTPRHADNRQHRDGIV